MASTLLDVLRATGSVADRVMATVDRSIGAVERLGTDAFRYGVQPKVEYATKAPKTVLNQIQPINVSAWDLTQVRNALEQHELGFFYSSVSLADAMGRDDRITACRNTRVRALAGKSGVGFSLTPSTLGKASSALDLATEVTDLWSYACSESVLSRILEDAVMLGVAFARIHWDRIDGRVIPRLEPWLPQTIYYDWSIRQYRAIGIEGQVVMDRGSAEWLIFEPGNYRSWMQGAIRGLGIPWLYRQFSRNDWSRYCEKHGLPIIAISEPAGHQWTAQKDRFYAGIKAIGRQGVIRLPRDADDYGFDVKYVEPRDKSWETFKEFIVRMDTDIAVMLLGQNLTTEVQGGSYAAAQAHEKVRLDYLDADAETLSTCLRDQVWKPFVRFNYGADREEQTPYPTWMTRPPADAKARTDIVKTYVDIGKSLSDPNTFAMAPVDMTALATDLNITVIDHEERASDDDAVEVGETKPQLYAYHFQFGLVRINEGRAFIGLPPIEGGEAIATPVSDTSGAHHGDAQQTNALAANVTELKTNAGEPTKAKARHEVEYLIRIGKLPHPNDVKCADCGHKGPDRDHSYDHHKGYTGENATNVQAVCTTCHRVRDGQNLPPAQADAKPKKRRTTKATALNTLAMAVPTQPMPERVYAGGRIRIRIDRPAGYVQRGVSADGVQWERTYLTDYGYLVGTRGGDGDELDCYCGSDVNATTVYVIAQINDRGEPDEYKLFVGFTSEADALATYYAHTPARYFGGIASVPTELVCALRGEEPVAMLAVLASYIRTDDIVALNSSSLNSCGASSQWAVPYTAESAAHAHAMLGALVNMSDVELARVARTVGGRDAATVARTIHLTGKPLIYWTEQDTRAAQRTARSIVKMLGAPATPQRDRSLRLLGANINSATDATAAEELRATCVAATVRNSLHGARALPKRTRLTAAKPAATTLKVDPTELDEAYRAWRDAVNMTAAELEAWGKTEASRLASVDPSAVIERNLRLLRRPKSEWDERDIRDSRRTVAFIARMKEMPRGEPVRKGMPSKRDIALRNWAYDPSK